MASITMNNLVKRYPGGVTAVKNVDLEINDKEFVVLVGPSGCGKSTTLRMIAGLEEISEGDIHIGDRLVNDVAPKDRDIAMVFQNYALYPHMTVEKNMSFGLELRKMPRSEIKKKVEAAAKALGIEHLLGRKPKALSGGERQRVALGRAMVRDPSVFLLDEPLSNLDAKLRSQMRTEIAKLHKTLGTTFVYVTHDQVEAMTMGDRIVVMKDGIIQQIDTPQNVYDKPVNLFVAGFIGSPQMNFINSKVIKQDGGYFIQFGRSLYGKMLIPIPGGKASAEELAPWVGKPVVLGIRPEALHNEPVFTEAAGAATLEVKVELAEMMGSEVYLYLNYDDIKLIAKVPARTGARADQTLTLAIDTNKMHLFDKETGDVIFH